MAQSDGAQKGNKDHVEFIKNVTFVTSAEFLFRLRSLFFVPILVKLMGKTGYGIWAQTNTIIYFFISIFSLNITSALVRFTSGEVNESSISEHFSSILAIGFITGLIGGVVLFLSSSFLSGLFIKVQGANMVLKYAAVYLMALLVYRVTIDFLRARLLIFSFSLIRVIVMVLDVTAVFLILYFAKSIGLCFLFMSFNRAGAALLILIWIYYRYHIRFPRFCYLKAYLKYSLPQAPALFFRRILLSSDRLVIGYYIGVEKVGIYHAAAQLASLIVSIYEPIRQVLTPTLVRLWENFSIEEVKDFFSFSFRLTFLIVFPVSFILTISSSSILEVLANPDFARYGSPVVYILILSVYVDVVYRFYTQIFRVAKRTTYIFYTTITGAVLNLLGALLLVPVFGVKGAAVSTVIGYVGSLLFTLRWALPILSFKLPVDYLLKYLFASILMATPFKFLNIKFTSKLNILIYSFAALFIYAFWVFILKGVGLEEKAFILNLLKRNKT